MATVLPVRGYRYNTERFGKDLTRFMAPPYDVIDGVLERRLKEDRLNIAHITLGDEGDGYTIAARRWQRWVSDGVVVEEPGECFYIYEQTFSSPDGAPMVRSGIIGLLRLEQFSNGVVLPHEKTIPKHRADRLSHMKALRGNTEQIFLLYDDPSDQMESILADGRKREEEMRFTDPDGVQHRIVKIQDRETIDRVSRAFEDAKILIADGHHRYETALEYRDLRRSEDGSAEGTKPYDMILATFVSSKNPGLVVYPTHRLVSEVDANLLRALPSRLEEEFDLESHPGPDELADAVERSDVRSFGVWIPASGTCLRAVPKDLGPSEDMMEDLPVYMVQERVLKRFLGYTPEMLDRKVNIDYVKGTGPTKMAMDSGEYQACFFVKPPSIDQVMAIAQSGRKMPHKSTYFFPKVWSGPLMRMF